MVTFLNSLVFAIAFNIVNITSVAGCQSINCDHKDGLSRTIFSVAKHS